MKRIIMMLALTALLVVALSLSAVTAFAANAPPGCYKDRGTIYCPDPPKNENNPFTQQTSKKGSINSSHPEESQCLKKGEPSDHCPPGQF
jgi:hypothetical protein